MTRMMRLTVVLLCLAAATSAGSKPIDYVVNSKGSRMTIAVNGPVEWMESSSGTSLTITLTAPARHFIVKKMNYSFRDGIVRTFAMAPVHPDTERIRIALRKDQPYMLSYNASEKRFVIEFPPTSGMTHAHTSSVPAAAKKQHAPVKEKTSKVSAQKHAPVPAAVPIDIATIAVQQSQEHPVVTPAQENNAVRPVEAMNTSAVLLLIASTIIILAGGGAVGYIMITRRMSRPAPQPQVTAAAPVIPAAETVYERTAVREQQQQDDQEAELELAIEYAEQYLRSQGEFELQQRLEQLNSSSMQKRLEMAAVHQNSHKGNTAAAAEKLGISIGELDLASRLQKFHSKQMTESV